MSSDTGVFSFEAKNEWESISYVLNGADVDAKTLTAVVLEFPDGHVEEFDVSHIQRSVDYQDHGHTYTAVSTVLAITLNYHGMTYACQLLPGSTITGFVVGVR